MKENALFIQRFGAFVFDIILVVFVATIISMPFINTDNSAKLEESIKEISQDYVSGNIDNKTFINEYSSVFFQLEKQQGGYIIANIILCILYFIVLQYYTGQTLGKKIFKIKLESTRKHLSMNQVVVRALLINTILVSIIELAYIVFGSESTFFYVVGSFEFIQYIFMIVCAFMIMFRKDRLGLHDLICKTKVVRC